jgi:uncharacterized protein YutE (UPF0331/DUF86 family)
MGKVRDAAIRIKLQEMTESVDTVKEHLPHSADSFRQLGIIKDGIYKRAEYAIENVFDICAILNADLHLGVPAPMRISSRTSCSMGCSPPGCGRT